MKIHWSIKLLLVDNCSRLTSDLLGTPNRTESIWFWTWKTTHLNIVANSIKGESRTGWEDGILLLEEFIVLFFSDTNSSILIIRRVSLLLRIIVVLFWLVLVLTLSITSLFQWNPSAWWHRTFIFLEHFPPSITDFLAFRVQLFNTDLHELLSGALVLQLDS